MAQALLLFGLGGATRRASGSYAHARVIVYSGGEKGFTRIAFHSRQPPKAVVSDEAN